MAILEKVTDLASVRFSDGYRAAFQMVDIWSLYDIKIRGMGNRTVKIWRTHEVEGVVKKSPYIRRMVIFLHRRPSFQSVFQFPARFEKNDTVGGNVHGGQGAGVMGFVSLALPYLESAQALEFYRFPGCYGGGQGLNEPACQFPRLVNVKAGSGPDDLLYILSGKLTHGWVSPLRVIFL
jgi:hypothetical protein